MAILEKFKAAQIISFLAKEFFTVKQFDKKNPQQKLVSFES